MLLQVKIVTAIAIADVSVQVVTVARAHAVLKALIATEIQNVVLQMRSAVRENIESVVMVAEATHLKETDIKVVTQLET